MTIDMERLGTSAPCAPCKGMRARKIAIVGGGFSGTLVLAHLAASGGACEIQLFEVRPQCGPGIAYGTCEEPHLLNVQAGRMGAFEADHFHRWLQSQDDVGPIDAAAYVSRGLYGRYLKDLLADALNTAARRGIAAEIVEAPVTDIAQRKDGMLMITAGTRRHEADAVVLATGNFPPRAPLALSAAAQRSRRYVGDIWREGEKLSDRMGHLSKHQNVLILGTGLTAVDAILSLKAHGFEGKIVAMSRHGRLPLTQLATPRIPWTLTEGPEDVAPSARALLSWLRREARLAEAEGVGWRSVFDAVRPFTQTLWRALDTRERIRLMRKLSLWNIHRHRMAPEAQGEIDTLRETGRLEVLAARCTSIERRLGGFTVRYRRGDASEVLRPALIVNCIGPEHDVARIDHPLFKNLLRRRLVVRSQAGGIAVHEDGIAEGRNDGRLFAIGPLLIGELLETTAVPELRELARHVAGLVSARLGERASVWG